MSDKEKKAAREKELEPVKKTIEEVVGYVSSWEDWGTSIRFRTCNDLNLKLLTKLSEALGTSRINFNLGMSPERGYSEYTPSSDGEPGYIEVLWPIVRDNEDAK